MEKTYFSLDEDFEKMIKQVLKEYDILRIKNISTGWTNIVFEVYTNFRKLFF